MSVVGGIHMDYIGCVGQREALRVYALAQIPPRDT